MSYRDLLNSLLFERTTDGRIQFLRYIFVGGFSAVVNLFTLYVFTSLLGFHYLFSEGMAFIVATIVNYVLSILWIFERSNRFGLEFVLFTLVGVGGLGINELVLWTCVAKGHLYYLLGEAIAIWVVMIWSFTLRKLLFAKLTLAIEPSQ